MPVESIIGTNPRAATVPVMSTGRSRASRACSMASRFGMPRAIRSRMALTRIKPFEHRRPGEGDEAHAGRDGERKAHDVEPEDAADAGEEHAAENHQGVAERVEREVEEAQDEGEGQGHDDVEPPLGPLHVLELAAPIDRSSRTGASRSSAIRSWASSTNEPDVAAADVGLDDDSPLAPIALDGRGAFRLLEAGEPGEREPLPARGRDEDPLQRRRVVPVLLGEPHDQRESGARAR